MKKIISYKDTGLLLQVSENTVRGYGTTKGGNLYKREGGVPYESLADLLRIRISFLKNRVESTKDPEKKNELEKSLKILRNRHHMVTQRSFEAVMIHIASLRKIPVEEKGLSKKVLESEEKEKIPESKLISEEESKLEKYEEPDSEESEETEKITRYNHLEELEEKHEEKRKKTTYPYLSNRELNMKLDDLVDLTLRKINALKKSRNMTPKKLEKIRELETKYRSIYIAWKDGIFDRN